jgi:hypothetical protein
MDERAVRLWGLVVGGGAIAAALGVATLTERSDPLAPSAPSKMTGAPPVAAPPSPPPPVPDAKAIPASGEEPKSGGAPMTFVVAFEEGHPLRRAQALEAQGRHAAAVRAANEALRAQRELRGLCYDRFTVGGAEIVLRLCTPPADAERAAVQRRWAARLAAMDGVAYAEPNVIAQPEQRK